MQPNENSNRNSRGIVWRLYLTLLTLLTLGLVSGVINTYIEYKKAEQRGKALGRYIEKYFTSGQQSSGDSADKLLADLGKDPGDWETITLDGANKDCLLDLIETGGWIHRCYSSGIEPPEILKSEFNIRPFEDIGGPPDWEIPRTILVLIFLLLVIRYWSSWLRTGRWPKTFP